MLDLPHVLDGNNLAVSDRWNLHLATGCCHLSERGALCSQISELSVKWWRRIKKWTSLNLCQDGDAVHGLDW